MAKDRQSPLDGGYSYVIAIAVFLAHVLQYGFTWTVGVWYTIFQDTFNTDSKYVALISSLNTASFYVAGPFSSFLINMLSSKTVAVIGSLIGCSGLIASMFATNVYTLYLTFGIITGFGFGLSYIPGVTMVGFYFEKRRSLAMGFAVSGCGIGTFLFPPLINYLINKYSLQGALLLMGGVCLHTLVIACLYRTWTGERGIEEEEIVTEDVEKNDVKSLASNAQLNGTVYKPDMTSSKMSLHRKQSLLVSRSGLAASKPSLDGSSVTLNSILLRKRMLSVQPNFCRTVSICDLQPGVLYGSKTSMHRSRSILNSRSILGGSIQLLGEHNGYTPMPESDTSSRETLSQDWKTSLYLDLFLDLSYVALCLNNLFFCFGLSIVYVHLGSYAKETLRLSNEQSAHFFSAIGIANFFGRFAFGAICQVRFFKPICVFTLAFLVTGIVTELCPLFDEYAWVMCYAASFGFLSGSFGALLPSVIIQVTDLDKLSSAYGYLLVFEAIGTLLGAPLAGWLYDTSGIYKTSFYLGGFFIILSALVMIYPWRNAREETEIEEQLSQYGDKIEEEAELANAVFEHQIKATTLADDLEKCPEHSDALHESIEYPEVVSDNTFSCLRTIKESGSSSASTSDCLSDTALSNT